MLFFKVTVVLDFYRELFGFALNELVLIFELLTEVWFIPSGEASRTRRPVFIVLLLPTKMLFF